MYKLGMFVPGNDTLATILSLVLTVVPLFLAIDAYRVNKLGGFIQFKQAFQVGFLTTLVLGILGGIIWNYIFIGWIAPELGETISDAYFQEMIKSGMGKEEALQAVKYANNPLLMTIGYFIVCTIFGTISSLILAAFMKNE